MIFAAYPQTQAVGNVKANSGATIHVLNSNTVTSANTIRHKGEYEFNSFKNIPFCNTFCYGL